MASRWFNLLLGVILLQSVLAFGPIDVTDAEWIEYMELINSPNYRLPTTTRPTHYKVRLQPNLDQDFELSGDVEINIKVESGNQPITEIKLHCQDMVINSLTVTSTTNTQVNLAQGTQFVCEETTSFLTIPTTTQLPNGNEYIIKISFVGKLQSGMRGFYRSWFFDENKQKRWMATTQFQPGHARQAFPCYDEPGFKATFDIILVRDDSLISLSNMPIEATVPSTLYPQKKEDIYYTTPIMSTYLLAFIVADYKRIESGTNVNRPFHIYARGNVGDTGKYSLEVGEKLLTLMESYTQYDYYTMANKMEMKQAAIPDFSAGAMENWGLLTYREALILYDPENSNNFYKQRIANIISHEIAHMWFGNLVTCAWWDTLWLNEGFARYYQYYMTDKAEPHMGFKTRFIVEQLQMAMLSDSFSNAHALTNPAVSDPDSVSNHFSTITYAKGASILRMTEHLLGGDTYEKGLREYLKKREFNTAEPKDLFESLDAAANADNSLADYDDMTIAKYFASWSEKAGHPLLTVHVDHASGRMTVVQTQFDVNSGVSSDNGLWHIPLTWTRAGNPEFENLKPSEFMSGPLKIINRGSTGREWVIFNKQQSGFYRVNYDATTWALLTQALRSNEREAIHEYNRAQIVDDVFVLARSNILSYTRALNILSFLEFEDKYAPWVAAITGFNFALRRLAHKIEEQQKLKDIIFKSSAAIIQRLGYTEASNADPLFMDNLLRMHLMTFLCNAGHAQCSQTGKEYFKAWRESGTRIPPNMRPWVYCEGLRTGDLADFDYFWNRYVDEDLSNEKVVMIGAAGCTGNTAALHKFLSVIVDPKPTEQSTELIRPQDYSAAISSAVTSNEYNTMKVLEWLKDNPSHLQNGNGVSLLRSAASRLLNELDILQVETWFATITSDEAIQAIKDGIATSNNNIKWYNSRVGEFSDYFETGYFDDLTDGSGTPDPTTPEPTTAEPTTPEPTTPEPTTAEPTTAEPTTDESTPAEPTTAEPTTAEPEPGSANIASLSFFTLLVTLIINMV